MSTSPQSPPGAFANRISKRRANSCVPCRQSKSRCHGGMPCSTCQKKRHKPRCYYPKPTPKDGEDGQLHAGLNGDEDVREGSSGPASAESTTATRPDDVVEGHEGAGPHEFFFGAFSLVRSVDEFNTLFAVSGRTRKATPSVRSAHVFGEKLGDDNSPAAESSPSVVRRLTMMPHGARHLPTALSHLHQTYGAVRALLDAGFVVQAWTKFSALVREAELLGLDQEPRPEPPQAEARRRMWWQLIDLDVQLSFLLGRRPLIPPSHSVAKPALNTLRQEERNLCRSNLDFAQYLLEVLTETASRRPSGDGQSELKRRTLESYLPRLQKLQTKFPHLAPTTPADTAFKIAAIDHELEIHLFSVVIYCQIIRSTTPDSPRTAADTPTASPLDKPCPPRKLISKGFRKEVLQSVRRIVDLFDLIHALDPPRATSSLLRCFGLYCAAVILGLARSQREDDHPKDPPRLQRALKVFEDLAERAPTNRLAPVAVASLSAILYQAREEERHPAKGESNVPSAKESHTPTTSGKEAKTSANDAPPRPANNQPSPANAVPKETTKRKAASTQEDSTRAAKRLRQKERRQDYDAAAHGMISIWAPNHDPVYAPQMSSFTSDMSTSSFANSAKASFDEGALGPGAPPLFHGNTPLSFGGVEYTSPHGQDVIMGPPWHPPLSLHPPMFFSGWDAPDGSFGMVSSELAPPPDFYNSQQYEHPGPSGLGPLGPAGAGERGPVGAGADSYSRLAQSMSSPILGDGFAHQGTAYDHPGGLVRRQSVADVPQHSNAGWIMETPDSHLGGRPVGAVSNGTDRHPTPPREKLISPMSGGGSEARRNSATVGQIAAQAGHLHSRPGEGGPPPQAMPNDLMNRRRASQVNGQDMAMMNAHASGNAGAPPPPGHDAKHSAWPPYPANQDGYSMSGPVHMEMEVPEHRMNYEPHFPHHLAQQHVVTTGPFTGHGEGQRYCW